MKSILIASAFFALVPAAHALDLPRLIKPETLTAHREALAFTAEQETELTTIYETAKTEAGPLEEAVRKEAERKEVERTDAAREEAVRREAARKEADRKEAERQAEENKNAKRRGGSTFGGRGRAPAPRGHGLWL